jgi:hypothetical protein
MKHLVNIRMQIGEENSVDIEWPNFLIGAIQMELHPDSLKELEEKFPDFLNLFEEEATKALKQYLKNEALKNK